MQAVLFELLPVKIRNAPRLLYFQIHVFSILVILRQ